MRQTLSLRSSWTTSIVASRACRAIRMMPKVPRSRSRGPSYSDRLHAMLEAKAQSSGMLVQNDAGD